MQQKAKNDALEWIERQALNDLYQAAPETTRRALGMKTMEIGGATLFMAPGEPGILLNRVIGLGLRQPAVAEDIETICSIYAAAGVRDYVLSIQPWVRPATVWNWLFDAGLARNRGWTQFTRGVEAPSQAPECTLRIAQIGPALANDFARIAADGFDLSNRVLPAIAGLVGRPGWYHFMSFDGDRPAGVAALRVASGVAWFDWGVTRPEFRRRGSQTALLNRRIEKAIELGCHTLCSETGEAVPGDPQHSFRNLVKVGFRPTHTRDNFSPAAVTDQRAQGRLATL